MKLVKFPNGDWIDPATIKAIRPLETTENGSIRARVVIHHGDFGTSVIYATDNEHAQQLADEYAALVNA